MNQVSCKKRSHKPCWPLRGCNRGGLYRLFEPLLSGTDERAFSEYGPAHHGANRGVEIGFPYGELYHLEEAPDELYNLYNDPAHAGARGAHLLGKPRFDRLC